VSSGRRKKTFYEILGVAESCSLEEIKKEYRGLAQELHPDKGASPAQVARMKEVNDAYATLSIPSKRRDYDAGLRKARAADEARERAERAGAARKRRARAAAEAEAVAQAFGDNSAQAPPSGTPSSSSGHTPPRPAGPPPSSWSTPPGSRPPGPRSSPAPQPISNSAPNPNPTPPPTPSSGRRKRRSNVDVDELITSGFAVLLWFCFFGEAVDGFKLWYNPLALIPVIGWVVYALAALR
jgi:curved DNA-binding protein CbpA